MAVYTKKDFDYTNVEIQKKVQKRLNELRLSQQVQDKQSVADNKDKKGNN
ncbi:MAG: hypothetical protein IKA41_03470 [Bacteroidaceae bacterium]|nr:hypothetical protein [Bacteroidaceae bacterium]